MQAHSQSSPAARSPYQVTRTTASSVQAQSVIPSSPGPATSIAKGLGLAHDAGNLLGALGLYCDLLSAPGVLQPEHQHYIAQLRQLSTRSGALIHRLLAGPAPAAEPPPLPASSLATAFNAAETLRHIEPLLDAIAGPAIQVVCRAPRSLPAPSLPPEALERILVNLVRNAAQAIELSATPATRGHIRIALATVAGQPRLTVEDNGPGMTVPTAAAFVSPAPLAPGARSGLGHRIVHELVTASGGRLSLRVRPGRGTTITVLWPASSAPEAAPRPPAASRRNGVSPC